MSEDFLFVEKYRPKKIKDCILPSELYGVFENIIKSGEIPNMLFSGGAGVGKTTVARALCNELDLDYLVINASMDVNIDSLRNKIKQFASTVSLQGGYKVVVLDEADYLNNHVQPALRGFIEEFSNNCRFILTCNFKNRIIEPIHSRCSVYEFAIPPKERPTIAKNFFLRLKDILKNESIEYDDKALAGLIEKHFPDYRRILNEVQRYGIGGKIDAGILVNMGEENIKKLIKSLKDKDFKAMRKWVADNKDLEPASIFRKVFDGLNEYTQPQSIPQAVLILADYQYRNAFVADHELNLVACMTEIMGSVEFK